MNMTAARKLPSLTFTAVYALRTFATILLPAAPRDEQTLQQTHSMEPAPPTADRHVHQKNGKLKVILFDQEDTRRFHLWSTLAVTGRSISRIMKILSVILEVPLCHLFEGCQPIFLV